MPINPNNLLSVINKNKSKKLAATKIIETNPKTLPIIPKLVRPNDGKTDPSKDLNVSRPVLEKIYKNIATVQRNNSHITQLFPEIELAIQILVSSILSPKKMTDITLSYKFDKKLELIPATSSAILTTIKDYVNDNYELDDKLPDIVREALFETGAAVYAVIPEASVDQSINSDLIATYSTEDFKNKIDSIVDSVTRPINIINQSNTPDPSLDSTPEGQFVKLLVSQESLSITDNVKVLGFSELKNKVINSVIRSASRKGIAISTESADKIEYMDIFRKKNNPTHNVEIEFVKTRTEASRKSVGKPMAVKLPTESVIPVFIPGDEKEHIGYFVMLDETGKPVSLSSQDSSMDNVEANLSRTGSTTMNQQTNVITKAYKNLVDSTSNNVDTKELFELYKSVLEKQIFNSVRSSLNGSNVDISRKSDIFFLMFTRAMSGQRTGLLYLPKELVTYFAFNYNPIGTGKTLLENITVLSSLRAIMLFSKVMAYSKHAIDVTKVNISLDPNDPDPDKTIEIIKDSVYKLRQNYLPLGIINLPDLSGWVQKAGLQFAYENNPLLPDVKINFENSNLEHTIPDSELEEDLRKQTFIALGLPPELIDNGFSPEFAVSVVNNNILLSKRVMVYQKALIKHLNKYISQIVYNDEDLRAKLSETIFNEEASILESLKQDEKELFNKDKEAFVDYLIDKISDSVSVELPKPDNTNITNLSAEYDVYKDNLVKVMDSVISADIFSSDIAGAMSEHVDTVKNIYIHKLLRDWMAENDFYPEVLELSAVSDEFTDTISNTIKEHLTGVMRNSVSLMREMQEFKSAADKDMTAVDDQGASSMSGGSSGSSYDDGSGDEGGSDAGEGGEKNTDDILDF